MSLVKRKGIYETFLVLILMAISVSFAQMPQIVVSFAQMPQIVVSFAQMPQIVVSFAQMPQIVVSFAQMPQIVVHRGASYDAPENTLASFQ